MYNEYMVMALLLRSWIECSAPDEGGTRLIAKSRGNLCLTNRILVMQHLSCNHHRPVYTCYRQQCRPKEREKRIRMEIAYSDHPLELGRTRPVKQSKKGYHPVLDKVSLPLLGV
jgi:hypothetical protein